MKKIIALTLSFCMIATTGCSQKTYKTGATFEVLSQKSITTEVIIVGAGPSGIMSALTAVENGAKSVVILEKSVSSGGAMQESYDCLSAPNTKIQKLDNISGDNHETYYDDLFILGLGEEISPNEDLLRLYAEKSTEAVDWVWDQGLLANDFKSIDEEYRTKITDEFSKYSFARTYEPIASDTFYYSATHELLDKLLLENPEIEVFYSTEAISLHPNSSGQILTVLARYGEEKLQFNATSGIIMASGSHTKNTDLISSFNEANGQVLTTDGMDSHGLDLKMMQEVGASVSLDTMGLIDYSIGFEVNEETRTGIIATTNTASAGGIIVNQNGERFVNEVSSSDIDKVNALLNQPNGIQYEIYTEEILADLFEFGNSYNMQKYFTSSEFSQYVISANTIEELAIKLDLPMDVFMTSVIDYNVSVSIGVSDDFGRDCGSIDGVYSVTNNKIESERYYAVKTELISVGTLGGVIVNENMQVLDDNSSVIPGLFACGEVVGGVFGTHKAEGVALTSALTFGRIAGESAMILALADTYLVQKSVNTFDDSLFWEIEEEEIVDKFSLIGAKDGEYEVEVDGQEGKMKVLVAIENEKLMFIQVLSNHETANVAGDALILIPEAIVKANTTSVDGVTGATLTSDRIKKAVEMAVLEARK